MDIIANALSKAASLLAFGGSKFTVGWIWEEPACPEEIL